MKNRSAIIVVASAIIIPFIFYFLFSEKDEAVKKPNRPPISVSIPLQIINEGDQFAEINLHDYFTDPDGDKLAITINAGIHLETKLSKNGVLIVSQPNDDWFGTDTISVTATDTWKLFTETDIIFTVNPVNDAPVISKIPDQTINEGEAFTPIRLNNFVSDIDNTPDEISWIVFGHTLVDVKIDRQNVAYLKVKDENTSGTDTLLFIATDPEHLAATKRVIFKINPVNDPPQLQNIELSAIYEGGTFPKINLEEFAEDIDTPKENLKFSVRGGKCLSILIEKENCAAIAPPHADWFGKDTLFYSVSDSEFTTSASIIAEVIPVNDAPSISSIPHQSIKEDDIFNTVVLNDFVNDVDNNYDELNWEFSGNMIVDIKITPDNVMEIIAKDSYFGSDTVTISVSDPEKLSASSKVIFTVVEKTFWERAPFNDIKSAAHIAVDDILALAVSPYYWDGYDYLKFGIFTSATIGFTSIDKKIQTEVFNDRTYQNNSILRFGEYYGRNNTSIGASIGFFGIGLLTGESELTQIGLEIFESYAIVDQITSFLKNGFGRERPYNGTGATNFYFFQRKGQDFYSLPSGHTSLAFSLSSVIAAHTDNILLKALIFTPAVITAVERVYNNNHWVSDVILGGAIGYYIGNFIVSRHLDNEESNFKISVNPLGQLGFTYKFD